MTKGICKWMVSLLTVSILAVGTIPVSAGEEISKANTISTKTKTEIKNEESLVSPLQNTEDNTASNTEDAELTNEEMLEMESISLSSLSLESLTEVSNSVMYSGMPVDNHGLADGISFIKYEINYNKYDTNEVEYIVIHDTGNTRAGANALAHYYYFASGDRDSSAHYFVDSEQVVQIIDDSEGSWHSGVKYKTAATPISNHNSIGIEMCINSDGNYTQTVQNTIDLAAYLLYKYNLPIESLVRHYDANGKNCPMTMSANNWSDWNEFVAAVRTKLATYRAHGSGSDLETSSTIWYYNNIYGTSSLSAETLKQVLLTNNASISETDASTIASSYLSIGSIYGIRGDIAFFQAMVETGYLNYGGEVDASWHNYCGLKNADATGYACYATIEEGVEAHIQHLYCYATDQPIPSGRMLLDPRFFDFLRGTVTTWEELGGRWAVPGYDPTTYNSLEEARNAHRSYGDIIVALYASWGGNGVMTDGVSAEGLSTGAVTSGEIYTGTAAGTRAVLISGQSGSDVKEIQGYLKTIGYSFLEVNGQFDDATLRAVMDFQGRNSLTADGTVGEYTWKCIINTYVSVVQTGLAVVDAGTVPSLEQLKNGSVSETSTSAESTSTTAATVSESVQISISEKTGISVQGRSLVFMGSSGEDVKALQNLLNELGYGLDPDGIFGSGTNQAVISFQSKQGLDADGYVGSMTWASLGNQTVTITQTRTEEIAEEVEQIPVETATPTTENTIPEAAVEFISTDHRALVYVGCSGEDVKVLQTLLNRLGNNLVVDGAFGDATRRSVVSFQSTHGLDADGYVGSMTWAELGKTANSVQESTSETTIVETTVTDSTDAEASSNHGTVYFGDSGSDVTALQKLLVQRGATLEVDGFYGSATYNALTTYQASAGLAADGVCGPLTWASFT